MMNDDMLRNIEYLREKADVSYEEAANLLERFDGNVMRVLVELERQGRVYQHDGTVGQPTRPVQEPKKEKKPEQSFLSKALSYHLVVESGTGEKKKTVANLSAPFCGVAAVAAPHVAIGSAALMFALGYRVKIKKEAVGKIPDDVEEFVGKTVSNIKQTASSLTETVQDIQKAESKSRDDDDDEGGEITVE